MTITRSQTNMFNIVPFSSLENYIYLNHLPESFDASRRIAFMLGKNVAKQYDHDKLSTESMHRRRRAGISTPGRFTYSTPIFIKTSSGLKKIEVRTYPRQFLQSLDNTIKNILDNTAELTDLFNN